jgi:hypothetical protein
VRRAPASRQGVYGSLIERSRRLVDTYGHLNGNPYRRQLARLEAGESADVHVWQLPGRPRDYGLDLYDRVRVWPDDRIEGVEVVAR